MKTTIALILSAMILPPIFESKAGAAVFETGLASHCVMDSQYLAASEGKGFEFDTPSKKSVLDLAELNADAPGISFHNAQYRKGGLQSLSLAVAPMPGVSGIAVWQDGDGDSSFWDIQCYRPDSAFLMGTQSATPTSHEGVVLYGTGSKFGWPLLSSATQAGWIFIPSGNGIGLPGTIPGRVIEGKLTVGNAKDVKVRLPGRDVDLPCKRIKVKFRPKSRADWTCSGGSCTSGPGDEESLDAYARVGYVYWRDNDGILAEVSRMKQANDARWRWQWFSPGK